MTPTDLPAVLVQWESAARRSPTPAGHAFSTIAARYGEVQARIEALRSYPPSFDGADLDAVLTQLHSARRMRRQIVEGNDLDVLVPTLRAFLFDDEPLAHKFATYPALIRYAGLPILGELFGWVHAERYPLYTQRALAALRWLGWSVPAHDYPSFTVAFNALRQAYESAALRLAPELPINLEIDQFLAWVSQQAAARPPAPLGDGEREPQPPRQGAPARARHPAAIREYGSSYRPDPASRLRLAAAHLEELQRRTTPVWPDAPLPAPSKEHLAQAETAIRSQLALPPDTIRRAAAHLVAGRHLVLAGAPGTGKSHLAQLLACELFGYEPMLVTATAEWSAFDVVGGFVPVGDEAGVLRYTIRPGYVYEALRQNWALGADALPRRDEQGRPLRRSYEWDDGQPPARGLWLIVDELNRADVDKAFGELFSALESGFLRVPRPGTEGTVLIPLPRDFRIIATLNTRDRHFLFTLSDALKRRFAFLTVAPPSDAAEERAILLRRAHAGLADSQLSAPDGLLETAVDTLLPFARIVRAFHPLGTAPLLAALRYVGAASSLGNPDPSVDEAVVAELLPQLENLRELPLALLADLATGRPDAIAARFEAEITTGGADHSALQRAALGLSRVLLEGALAAADHAAAATLEEVAATFATPPDPYAGVSALVAALHRARSVFEAYLPRLSWPLTASQLDAWLAERML
ncbi:MAG TPA: MoxR family ATPase [Ardenticatenaceae bacterium]|nr:MoxR family ATPase [Ardenticatenaceae bacterium]